MRLAILHDLDLVLNLARELVYVSQNIPIGRCQIGSFTESI